MLVIYYLISDSFIVFPFIDNNPENPSNNFIHLIFYLICILVFIILELYCIWIVFIYTYNIILGNDAYVSGEYFNKYVENLASSRGSSHCGTPKKSSIYEEFKEDYSN